MFEHPAAGLAYGSPVVFGAIPNGYGVGVSFGLESAAADWIAVDTEGIWALTVLGTDDEGPSRVEIGDVIYINRTTAVLSKISSDTTNIVFGYALDTVDADGEAVICVKVHWSPHRTDEYRDYLSTAVAAEVAMYIHVDDASELAGDINRGLHVKYHNVGDKTGTAHVQGIAVDMWSDSDVPYQYGISLYDEIDGNPAIGFRCPLTIYSADGGTGVDNQVGIDIGLAGTNAPSARHTFIRMVSHEETNVAESMILMEGGAFLADYFVDFNREHEPIFNDAVGVTQDKKIRVRVEGVDYYIALYTT